MTANDDGGNRPLRHGDWTEAESQAMVDDYLAMHSLECVGQPHR